MRPRRQIILQSLLTTVFAVTVFVFFGFFYAGHLHYHEELQMFLYTGSYAAAVICAPGGLCDYAARFAVQFFYYPLLGAALMAVLLTGLQILTWGLMALRKPWVYPLTFIPSLIMWGGMCDENVMLSSVVSLIVSLGAVVALRLVHADGVRMSVMLVGIAALYMACGPLSAVFVCVALVDEVRRRPRSPRLIVLLVCAVAVYAATVAAVRMTMHYPVDRLLKGVHYMRFASHPASMVWVSAVSAVVLTTLGFVKQTTTAKARKLNVKMLYIKICGALALSLVCGYIAISASCDYNKDRAFVFDRLASREQWDEMISLASDNQPKDQMSAVYLNLALAKTGVLCESLTRFDQNGPAGLVTAFGDNFFMPLAMTDVYYHLGMNKASELFAYEILQSIPDAQMSPRCVKRLAETALVNGDYALARKYLNLLTHTLYYSDWARRLMPMAEAEILSGQYDTQRRLSPVRDTHVHVNAPDSMLVSVFAESPGHRRVFDYLAAYYLLDCDIEQLPALVAAADSATRADLPVALQEALTLVWSHDHNSWDGMPWHISDDVRRRFVGFSRVYRPGMTSAYFPEALHGTYWAYYFKTP